MRRTRDTRRQSVALRIAAAAVVLGALSLAGCAGDPDLAPLEASLSEVEGVDGALSWSTHAGSPWDTQVQVMLFVDDPSDDGIVSVVRAAAPVLVADDVASRHPVTIRVVDGERADYDDRFDAAEDEVVVLPSVFEALGVADTGPRSITLTPDDVRAIAGER